MYRNVEVTLQILRALIDKTPRDLPLYAPYVLRILSLVLESKDITMVEGSVPTFQSFCAHHDAASLAADQQHMRQYENIVKLYTGFAIEEPPTQVKAQLSTQVAIRWRSVALQAVHSITSSETLGTDGGRQLNIIVPTILRNLYLDDEDQLLMLQHVAENKEISEKETGLRRKMSNATVQTVDTNSGSRPAAVSGTTADADRLAEEEVGLLALQSLKQIFIANNRAQIRLATAAVLRFIANGVKANRSGIAKSARSEDTCSWTKTLLEMATRWAPVQDRFVILVTTMETLVRSPVAEENLEQQLVLVTLVGWLLGSSINMIGLSVMDVLLGLIQHILLLLQLGGKGSSVLPHYQQIDAIDLFKGSKLEDQQSAADANDVSSPSATRQELLLRIQRCIGDLATHIYYSDQISDIISAILLRLKPSPLSEIKSTAAAIERPAATAQAISDSVNLQEDPTTDEFFSFGTARVTALHAIKEVLTVANMKGSVTGAGAIGRNKVGLQVWEGTQWLLRDEDRRVRRAYVDALLTWLQLEMRTEDLRVIDDRRQYSRGNAKTNEESERTMSLARRAVSSASQRSKNPQPTTSSFLQLLHLAIYDNALESAESDSDVLLLHLLLANLVEKLGVHSVTTGLPMIRRLQEDINIDSLVPTPVAKLNIGSLVHGYFWILSEKFDFEATQVGHEVQSEISRRKKHGLWTEGIRMPPLALAQITLVASEPSKPPSAILQTESIKPFDSCSTLVDRISQSYSVSLASPPRSPPGSPSRVFSMPILSTTVPISSLKKDELPAKFKEEMLSKWTKESCIANVERDSTRAVSLNGSRTGTNRSLRNNYLAVDGFRNGDDSPMAANTPTQISSLRQRNSDIENTNIQNPTNALSLAVLPQHDLLRRSSIQENGSPTPISSSDQQATLRVDDLKRVLAGGALAEAFSHRSSSSAIRGSSPLRNTSVAYQDFAGTRTGRTGRKSPSVSTESVVSAERFESASEGDGNRPMPAPRSPLGSSALAAAYHEEVGNPSFEHSPSPARLHSRPTSRDQSRLRPRTASSASEDPEANAKALKGEHVASVSGGEEHDDDVPPVPPLPPNVAAHNQSVGMGDRRSLGIGLTGDPEKSLTAFDVLDKSGETKGIGETGSSIASEGPPISKKALNIRQLLSGIEVGDGGTGKGISKPPY